MNKPAVHALIASMAILCAVFLLWLWQADMAVPQSARPRRAPAPRPDTSATTPVAVAPRPSGTLSAAARSLLVDLERALRRRDVRPREAVLTFRDEEAFHRFLTRAHEAGLSVIGRVDALRSVRVRIDRAGAIEADVAQNAADYASAGANNLFGIPQPPARENRTTTEQVPFGNRTLAYLGADNNANWGRGMTIAVLDTGVAADPTLANRLRTLDIGLGSSPGTGASDGHGTGVAALAAGTAPDAPGVAPAANILSIRVTDASGTSDIFTLSQAIVAAVDAGAKVINISLGGYGTGAVLDSALTYAGQRGALVVAAAGNDQAAQLVWPAADRRVISVGAVDAADQQVSFSNSGPQLQLTAPGYGVQTAWLDGQRAYVNGTSASSPLVAGAIAAVMSQNPNLSPGQAAELLTATASDAGTPGADPAYGHGILNLGWAMNRDNPAYIDTAIASHAYDAAANQVDIVVQNRSGRAVTGMTLKTDVSGTPLAYTVPSLAAGESFTAKVPVDATALRNAGSIRLTTELVNPMGITDQVPANNQRTSVLTAPASPKE